MIKNLTYRNFMIIRKRIIAKGYTAAEAEPIVRRIFANYNPLGMSIEQMTERVLTKEDWENEQNI